jgi:hypothetical protein
MENGASGAHGEPARIFGQCVTEGGFRQQGQKGKGRPLAVAGRRDGHGRQRGGRRGARATGPVAGRLLLPRGGGRFGVVRFGVVGVGADVDVITATGAGLGGRE